MAFDSAEYMAQFAKRAQEYWEAPGKVPDTAYVAKELLGEVYARVGSPWLGVALMPTLGPLPGEGVLPEAVWPLPPTARLTIRSRENPQSADLEAVVVERRETIP